MYCNRQTLQTIAKVPFMIIAYFLNMNMRIKNINEDSEQDVVETPIKIDVITDEVNVNHTVTETKAVSVEFYK